MPRNVSASMIAALQSNIVRPAIFVNVTVSTGPVYFWTGWGTINWNGQTWAGVGTAGTVSNIEESSQVEAKGVAISLTGLDPTLLNDTLNDIQLGLPCVIWFGLFDANFSLIPDPFVAYSGRMDQPTISVNGESASISIALESRLLDMNVPVDFKFDADTQQLFFPNDQGFSLKSSIIEKTIYWGHSPSSNNNL